MRRLRKVPTFRSRIQEHRGRRGEFTGPVTERAPGVSPAAITTGGNRNDVTRLISLLQAVPPVRGMRHHLLAATPNPPSSGVLRAEDALARSDVTLAQIAAEVGYRNEYAFSTAFRRRHGVSPGKWRAAARTAQPDYVPH